MMHFDVVSVCFLLLLVLDSGALVDCTPEWEAGCDTYNVTSGKYPVVYRIHYQSTPLAQCRSLCTSRTHCGGFMWWIGNSCDLYNVNDHIIEQVAHVSQNWYGSWIAVTWYSKSCGYSLSDSDLSCNIYTDKQYHNQYPHNKWRIAYTWSSIPDLTATECQAWCTLYTACRSVAHRHDNSDGSGRCYLYETTVQDLLDTELDDDVVQNTDTRYTYTTYDIYCGDGSPYVPGQATTTRPSVDLHTPVKTTTKTAIVTRKETSTLSTLTGRPTEPPTDEAGSIGPLAQILIVGIVLILMGGVFMVMFVYRLKRRAKDASHSAPTQPPLPGLPDYPAAAAEDDGAAVYEEVDFTQAGYVRPRSGPFVRGQQVNYSDYDYPADLQDLVSQGSGVYTQMEGDPTNSAIIDEQPLGHLYENSQPTGSQHVYLQMAAEQQDEASTTSS